jgi:hypothetical protein
MTDTLATLRTSALWYGWGRQDSAHDARADVFAFAEHYVVLAQSPAGRPSIQQAWADYVAALPVACIVIPGKDGPTLWDCECSQCLYLQSVAP